MDGAALPPPGGLKDQHKRNSDFNKLMARWVFSFTSFFLLHCRWCTDCS